MATVWKRAAHSVYRMFSLYFDLFLFKLFSILVLRAGTMILVAPVPGIHNTTPKLPILTSDFDWVEAVPIVFVEDIIRRCMTCIRVLSYGGHKRNPPFVCRNSLNTTFNEYTYYFSFILIS